MEGAWFTWYGQFNEDDRKVSLERVDKDRWGVRVAGMPALTQVFGSYERTERVFLGYWDMAFKDWGASDIEWGKAERFG